MQTVFVDAQDNAFRVELSDSVIAAVSADDMAGELLIFRDAVLCRAEVNKNRDGFDRDGLQEIAASLPLMPIDDEHIERHVIGMFTAARVADDALLTDGIIYAKRFPEIASDVVAGKKKLSVEVQIGTAVCSVCRSEFTSSKQYCDHLRKPSKYGAARMVKGLKAIGGGVTYNPAGTDTVFDRSRIVFASEQTDGLVAAELSAALAEDVQEEGDMEELELLKAQVQELTASLTAANTSLSEKDALLADKDGEIARLQASVEVAEKVRARSITLLKAGYDEKQLQAIEGDLAVVSDAVMELLVASVKSEKQEQAQEPGDQAGESDQANASANGEGEDDKADGKTPSAPQSAVMGDSQVSSGEGVMQWSPKLFS